MCQRARDKPLQHDVLHCILSGVVCDAKAFGCIWEEESISTKLLSELPDVGGAFTPAKKEVFAASAVCDTLLQRARGPRAHYHWLQLLL